MYNNVRLINTTGREIPFDWLRILQSSPLFTQSAQNPRVWEMKNTASIAVGADQLCIHPGNEYAITQVLQALGEEASYLYDCEACIENTSIGQRFVVVLKPENAVPKKTVLFGRYFQKNNSMDPIEWIVLEERDGTALLLSKFALHTSGYWLGEFGDAYKENGKNLIWENSALRKWMNRDFCRMIFTEEERRLLLNNPIVSHPETDYHLHRNRMFLLSEEEVWRYLPTKKERQACATAFASFGGAAQYNGNCCWWILPGEEHYPKAVYSDGEIQYHSRNVAHGDWCIRPAVRIGIASLHEMTLIEPKQDEAKIHMKRLLLDDSRLYYLRTFFQDGAVTKVVIDKEAANDSHYELDQSAAKQLFAALQKQYGGKDFALMLRSFFKTGSDYGLVQIMKSHGIAFKQFHFY